MHIKQIYKLQKNIEKTIITNKYINLKKIQKKQS